MARFLYLVGSRFNSLSRLASAATITPAADTKYPGTNLADGFPENPLLWGSVVADSNVTADLNMVVNGDMSGNSGGNLTTWIEANTGPGDVTYDATGGVGAGPGMKLVSGAGGTASAYQDIVCRPGEELNLAAQLKSDGTNALVVRVQNLYSLNYLTSGGAWQSSATQAFSRTANTFAGSSLTFRVESWDALMWPITGEVTLRVTVLMATASVTAFADDVYLWPSTSWASVHGYDGQPQLAVELRRDTAAFAGAGTLEATLTPYRPAFYWASATTVTRTDRYWRLKLAGTPSSAPWIGELVLGQYAELGTLMTYGWSIRHMRDQVRTQAAYGASRTRAIGSMARRVWAASFQDLGTAAFDDFLVNVARRSGFGESAIVFAPDDTDPKVVIHGQLPPEITEQRTSFGEQARAIEIPEDPLPTFAA